MKQSAQSLYSHLETERHSYLIRARDASLLTIPTLVPPEGYSHSTEYATPFQSLGAKGVNNLAANLLLSLLPANASFFRLVPDQKVLQEIAGMDDVRTELDAALGEMERILMQAIEMNAVRVVTFEALKHLIVAGNALLHQPEDGNLRLYKLDQYCLKRDPSGNVKRIVIKEGVSASTLPEEAQAIAVQNMTETHDVVDLYTSVCLMDDDTYEVHQEINKQIIPGTLSTYSKHTLPYIALRMHRTDGESYGRSYVEQFMGDLKSLESLMQSIVEGSAAAAKILFLVNPNGVTRARTLAESPNGAIREGVANDISTLQLNKQADFGIAFSTIQQISERLSSSFLLTENTIRQAERVTAEEIRLVTQAIEKQLGGIYSVLSQEFQLPLIRTLMHTLEEEGAFPKLPENTVRPLIVTGLDALGRGNDLNKLDVFLMGIAQTLGPDAMMRYVNVREYMDRRAASLGLDTDGLIKSDEQIAQEQQAMNQDRLVEQFGNQALDIAKDTLVNPQQQE